MSLDTLLCTARDISLLKEFDLNTPPKKLNPIIRSAQFDDVLPLIGERLFYAVLKNPENYEELLNFGEYEHNDEIFVNRGLKNVIALYAHARFTKFGSATPTPYGMVEKKNPASSEEVIKEDKNSLYHSGKKEAYNAWESVLKYLVRTNNELYFKHCLREETQTPEGTMNFETVRRRYGSRNL